MTIRVECSTPGLEANWIEVDETWTRKELQAFVSLQGEAYWALWGRKVTACQVLVTDGGVVTDPAAVQEVLDDLDIRLLRWLSSAVLTATNHLLSLGEASALLLLDGVGVAAAQRPAQTMAQK